MTYFFQQGFTYSNKATPPNSATPWTKHAETTTRPMICSTLMFSAMSLTSPYLLSKLPLYTPALLDLRNSFSYTHTPSPLAMSYFSSPHIRLLLLDHNPLHDLRTDSWFFISMGKGADFVLDTVFVRVLLLWEDTMTTATHIKGNI